MIQHLKAVFKRLVLCRQAPLFQHQEVADDSREAWTPCFVPSLSHPTLHEVGGGQWTANTRGQCKSVVEGADRHPLRKKEKLAVAGNMIVYLKTQEVN